MALDTGTQELYDDHKNPDLYTDENGALPWRPDPIDTAIPWNSHAPQHDPDPANPTLKPGTFLGDLYDRRKKNHQDLFILITDYHNRRGTGKTIASLEVGDAMDATDDGLQKENCALDAERVVDKYTALDKRSSIILDESEKDADKYLGASKLLRALRRIVSMGRIEEKYLVLNAPHAGALDKDLKALADVWILVTCKGQAIVHSLGYNPYKNHPWVKKEEILLWDDLPRSTRLRNIYNHLTHEKQAHLRGDSNDQFIHIDDHQQALKQSRTKALRKQVLDIAQRLRDQGATTREIGHAVGKSRTWVSNNTEAP